MRSAECGVQNERIRRWRAANFALCTRHSALKMVPREGFAPSTFPFWAGRLFCWANAANMVLPAGLSPATRRFEAARSDTLSYGSMKWGRRRDSHSRGANARQFTKLLLSLLSHIGKMVGRHGAAPCSAV